MAESRLDKEIRKAQLWADVAFLMSALAATVLVVATLIKLT